MPFKWPAGMQVQTRQRVASILWTLRQQPGAEVTDRVSGRATHKLNDLCRELRVRQVPRTSPASYAKLITLMTGDAVDSPWAQNPLIERDVNSKRTYAIRLLVQDEDMPDPNLAWAPSFMPVAVAETLGLVPAGATTKEAAEVATEATVAAPDEIADVPEVTTEPEPTAAVDVRAETPAALKKVMAISKLATDLMIELSEIEHRHGGDEAVLGRLADALADNERLRGRVRDLEALVETKASEIASLRQSLKLTGANLERLRTAVNTNGHVDPDADQRALARLMQERPAAPATN